MTLRIASRARGRGFLMIDVMLTLGLLATFALVATRLLQTSLRVSRQAHEQAALSGRFEGVLWQMRQDVWAATKIETPDARTLRVEQPGREPITWAVADGGAIVRTLATAGNPPPAAAAVNNDDASRAARQEWPGIGAGITFEADGPVLLLVESAGRSVEGRRVPLVSQAALANGGRP